MTFPGLDFIFLFSMTVGTLYKLLFFFCQDYPCLLTILLLNRSAIYVD